MNEWLQSDNPPTQKEMGRRLGVSRRTAGRLIREDLALKRLKKPEVKRLFCTTERGFAVKAKDTLE